MCSMKFESFKKVGAERGYIFQYNTLVESLSHRCVATICEVFQDVLWSMLGLLIYEAHGAAVFLMFHEAWDTGTTY